MDRPTELPDARTAPGDEPAPRRGRRRAWLVLAVAAGLGLWLGAGLDPLAVLVALLATSAMLKVGFMVLGAFARPVPEPPPPGELRKVKLTYRCSVCGAEVRMTVAPDADPEPPRHCLEDMDLVAPVDE